MVLVLSVMAVVGATSAAEPLAAWIVVSLRALKAKGLLGEALPFATYLHDASKACSQVDYPVLWPVRVVTRRRWLRSECTFLVLAPALPPTTYAFAYAITPLEVVALAAPLPWQARER